MATENTIEFWKRAADDHIEGRETTFFDFHQEAVNGYGVNKLRKKYTPWGGGERRLIGRKVYTGTQNILL